MMIAMGIIGFIILGIIVCKYLIDSAPFQGNDLAEFNCFPLISVKVMPDDQSPQGYNAPQYYAPPPNPNTQPAPAPKQQR